MWLKRKEWKTWSHFLPVREIWVPQEVKEGQTCPFIYLVPIFLLSSYVGTSTDLHKLWHGDHVPIHSTDLPVDTQYSQTGKVSE